METLATSAALCGARLGPSPRHGLAAGSGSAAGTSDGELLSYELCLGAVSAQRGAKRYSKRNPSFPFGLADVLDTDPWRAAEWSGWRRRAARDLAALGLGLLERASRCGGWLKAEQREEKRRRRRRPQAESNALGKTPREKTPGFES